MPREAQRKRRLSQVRKLTESVVYDSIWVNESAVDGAKKNEGWDLEEANLEHISRADFHRQRNIAIHRKGYSVLG
jgi:hypothetical protein